MRRSVNTEDLDDIAGAWDELAERTEASPFDRPEWVRAWRDAFGRGRLLILTTPVGGELAGVLPLERRRGGLRSPANGHSPEGPALVRDPSAAGALADGLFAMRPAAVQLGPFDADSSITKALCEHARRAGYDCVFRGVSRAPYLRGRKSAADWRPAVGRNLRHDVERRLRRLCEVGAVSIQVSDGRSGLHALLDEGFAVERASWKGTQGTAIASDEATSRFYTRVAEWAAGRGWLRLALLRVDGHAIAFQLDLEVARTYHSLKIGYDPAYTRFSPGKILMYEMVCRAMEHRLESYELHGTDEPWKERWSEGVRERVALHAFSPSPGGRLLRTAFLARRTLARRDLRRRLSAAGARRGDARPS